MAVDREHSPDHPSRAAGRRSRACGSPRRRWQRCGLAEACGQLPSALIRGWVLERLRQKDTGEELLVSRDELARIVREQVEAALRKAS
jgi:hypothetical protein